MSRSMKETLASVLDRGNFPGISNRLLPEDDWWSPERDTLQKLDREFLQAWIHDHYADDAIWEEIVAKARQFRVSHVLGHFPLIWYALRARRLADEIRFGDDPLQRERENRRDELLALADAADALAQFWRKAEGKSTVLALGFPPFPIPFERVLQLQKLNEGQAQLLLLLAGAPPPPTTRNSRQKRSKKHDRSRECAAFMHSMVGHMREICGKPFYHAVATLTEIAFPEAEISIDDVRRVAKQATTRSGRRRKTDALSRKKPI
jgi:hypothetical protein